MKLNKAQAWPVVSKSFPDYTGKKFNVRMTGKVNFYSTNWEGGSRNYYKAVSLNQDSLVNSLPEMAPWSNPVEGKTVEIPQGWVVVEHSFFCGKDMGITIHCATMDLPKLLPNGLEQVA